MFEFFFKYPGAVFQKGQFVLLASWPVWMLAVGVVAAGGLLFWHVRRNRGSLTGARPLAIWMLAERAAALDATVHPIRCGPFAAYEEFGVAGLQEVEWMADGLNNSRDQYAEEAVQSQMQALGLE